MNTRQKKGLAERLKQPVRWDHPLATYTTFGIGGPAAALATVETREELGSLLRFVEEESIAWRILGGGSNLLVRDHGFDGVAVLLGGVFKKYGFRDTDVGVTVEAGAAVSLPKLLAMCVKQGYAGLEFGVGIPGTMGGAVIMNAGAWGATVADVLEGIEIVGRRGPERVEAAGLQPRYRKMGIPVTEPFAIVSVELGLKRRKPAEVGKRFNDYLQQRRLRQPKAAGSAGSIFKNPQGDSAGRLIEASGLKGMRVGGAEVSDMHANFIVNRGAATADDVLRLMERIQQKVAADSGVFLDPEVHIL